MRFVVAVLLGAVVCLLGRDKAAALTPDELLQSCEAVTSATPAAERDMVDIPAAGLPCWYYMSAVQDLSVLSVLSDESEVRLLHFCPPPDTTTIDFVEIFVRYAHGKSARSEENAAAFMLRGFVASFPCDSVRGERDGRLWRSVPGRRWYSDQRGDTPGSKEVVLIHVKRSLELRPDRHW